MRYRLSLLVPIVLIAALASAQQSTQQPQFVNAHEAKLVLVPGAPECATFAVEHGNPKQESSVTLVKLAGGCTVPMHWHSSNEQLMLVTGNARVEMQGEQPHSLKPGGYYFMPAHHLHQLSCKNGCTFHRSVDGPIDIHYVDSAGVEIPAEKALAAFGERPATTMARK
jgi:quercetin dioxygenase-like cupin family protein